MNVRGGMADNGDFATRLNVSRETFDQLASYVALVEKVIMHMYPYLDLRLSMSPPRLESTHSSRNQRSDSVLFVRLYARPKLRVPLRYLMMRLMAIQCFGPGFCANLAHSEIAWSKSALVSLM